MPTRADARRTLGLPPEVPVVVLVARLTSIKRPDRFVEIAARLAADHPDAIFAICGEGDLLAELRATAGPNMRFLGWRGDVETVYAASDVAVLTSDNEGMPVSLIEAAMCGVPAVATRVGSVAEVVVDRESGLLGSPDVEELAGLVSRLLTDASLRAQFSGAAAEHARAHFSRDRLVADTQALYEQLVVEKGL
jgi:glycosyltransferase involved in cell wall biosynthesis